MGESSTVIRLYFPPVLQREDELGYGLTPRSITRYESGSLSCTKLIRKAVKLLSTSSLGLRSLQVADNPQILWWATNLSFKRDLVITVETSQPFVVCGASGFFERRQIHPLLLLEGLIFRAKAKEQFKHPDLVSNSAKPSKDNTKVPNAHEDHWSFSD